MGGGGAGEATSAKSGSWNVEANQFRHVPLAERAPSGTVPARCGAASPCVVVNRSGFRLSFPAVFGTLLRWMRAPMTAGAWQGRGHGHPRTALTRSGETRCAYRALRSGVRLHQLALMMRKLRGDLPDLACDGFLPLPCLEVLLAVSAGAMADDTEQEVGPRILPAHEGVRGAAIGTADDRADGRVLTTWGHQLSA